MALSSTKSIDARAAQSRKLLEQHGVNVEDELFILVDESFTAWRADADSLDDSQRTVKFQQQALQLFKEDADKALLVVCNLIKIAAHEMFDNNAEEEWETIMTAMRRMSLEIIKGSLSGRTTDLALILGPQSPDTFTVPLIKNVLFEYKKEEMLASADPMKYFRQSPAKVVAHKECETKERLKALLGRMSEKAGPLKLPQRIVALKSRLNDPPTMKAWIAYHVETMERICEGLVTVPENLQKMKALTRLALAAHLWDKPTQVNDFIHAWVYKRSAEAVKLVWKDANAFQDSSTSRTQASYASLEGQITNAAWDDAIVKCLEDVPIQGITELVEEVDLPVVSQKRPAEESTEPNKATKLDGASTATSSRAAQDNDAEKRKDGRGSLYTL